MRVVTRYAPSPTGHPHIGNIRTALFSYLHAKSQNGKFLLRIEDTDRERLVPGSLESIEESLRWLDLSWDDEKIFQSDRRKIHQEYAIQLLEEGKAYKCYCTKDRLDKLRSEQTQKGLPPGYDRHCQNLSEKERKEHGDNGDKYVIRFAMPETGTASWVDSIRGKVSIEYKEQDDFIIIKSDGWPTYNFANVIDDHEMGITDVIRGEEFIPSTPKHLALYEAFGWEPPKFSHMPHINGSDGAKLSKRHGDTALMDYKDKGYLPEAMVNFLATLGWNDGTEKEIFNMKELLAAFSVERIGKSPAVFDLNKLNWVNGQYIRMTNTEDLLKQIIDLYPNLPIINHPRFERIVEIEKTRLTTLADIKEGNGYFLTAPKNIAKILVFKKSNKKDTEKGLAECIRSLTGISDSEWDKKNVTDFETTLRGVVESNNLSNGDVFWPVRVALSGLEKSPSPAELLWAIGKDESLARLNKASK